MSTNVLSKLTNIYEMERLMWNDDDIREGHDSAIHCFDTDSQKYYTVWWGA